MTNASGSAATSAAMPSTAPASPAIAQAAQLLLRDLEYGRRVDAGVLRAVLVSAFGASDAAGVWDWKTATAPGPIRDTTYHRPVLIRQPAQALHAADGPSNGRQLLISIETLNDRWRLRWPGNERAQLGKQSAGSSFETWCLSPTAPSMRWNSAANFLDVTLFRRAASSGTWQRSRPG